MGWNSYLVHNTREAACAENYWLCKVIIQGEGTINYQFARICNIEPLELFLDLLDILLQKIIFIYFSAQGYPSDERGGLARYFEHKYIIKLSKSLIES